MSTRTTTPKLRISPPLEAGHSLLSSPQLPESLDEALEYVSSRLAHKKLHLSLIVVRQEATISSPFNPSLLPYSSSSIRPLHSPISRIQTHSPFSEISSSALSAQSHSSTSSNASLSRTKWASLPSNPRDKMCTPPSPRTIIKPHTTSSPAISSPWKTVPAQNPYGIALLHASTLSPKATRTLHRIITRAEKRFPIGGGWLPTTSLSSLSSPTSPMSPTTPITSSPANEKATNTLIRRSLTQNTILFSSEGLTLLAIDSLYKLKSQLSTYTHTLSPRDLEGAVDELHRLVLSRRGRQLSKGEITGCYEWLPLNDRAMGDVDAAYKNAYGGPHRRSGLNFSDEMLCNPAATTGCGFEVKRVKLSLDTSCADMSSGLKGKLEREVEEKLTPVDVGESAKGKDSGLGWESPEPVTPMVQVGIQMNMVGRGCREDRGPGPIAPFDETGISPVTGREWAFLIGANACEIVTC